jgi:hypothetical protein
MGKMIAFFDEPTDFSLVQGGPLFQLLLRMRLQKPPTDLVGRRVVVMLLIAWMPLLLLSILSGHAFRGVAVPFLYDLGAQARLLLSVPFLVAAEVIVHRRIRPVVRQFLDRGIITPEDQPRFESVIASAMRLRNSVAAEVLLLALATFVGYWAGKRYIAMHVATWFAIPIGDHAELTAAGYWYVIVSLTIFRFLLVRWYFRLFVWYRFLWQVSRQVRLRLNALHPDRAGGLGFLSGSVFAFAPVLLAITVSLSGTLGSKILHEGATLPQFKLEIVAWMVCLVLLVLAPLFFFMIHLAEARRTGLREYGLVASRYVGEFRRKWIEGHAGKDEALIGSGDIQSLADLSNSYEVVRAMGLVPFGRVMVIRLVILIAVPLLPLTLTMVPLEQLIDRAMGVFF